MSARAGDFHDVVLCVRMMLVLQVLFLSEKKHRMHVFARVSVCVCACVCVCESACCLQFQWRALVLEQTMLRQIGSGSAAQVPIHAEPPGQMLLSSLFIVTARGVFLIVFIS